MSLIANQGEDPATAFNNLPGRHSDQFCIRASKTTFVFCVCFIWGSGIETSLMLAQPLCNMTIVSLMANQGEDPAAAFHNLPGRHSDHFCIKSSKTTFVVCVFDLGFRHFNILLLAHLLCKKNNESLFANQGKDPAAAFNNLPGTLESGINVPP